jgi:hypothetical protein
MFDEQARADYWERQHAQRRSEYDLERAERRAEWWDRYDNYLCSEEWARKRGLVLARDGNRCQARLDGCSMFARQVHHLTYRHVFNEPLFDLVAVCESCHDQLHPPDGE